MSPSLHDDPAASYPLSGTVKRNRSGYYIWIANADHLSVHEPPVSDWGHLTLRLDIDGPYPLSMASGTLLVEKDEPLYWVSRLEPLPGDSEPAESATADDTSGPEDLDRDPDHPGNTTHDWRGRIHYKQPEDRQHQLPYDTITVSISPAGQDPDRRQVALTFLSGNEPGPTLTLTRKNSDFRQLDIELDRTDDIEATEVVRSIDTHDHPCRPDELPAEKISISEVYWRAGCGVTVNSNLGIPIGAWEKWSDMGLHDTMLNYWSLMDQSPIGSREPAPSWAMWVLFTNLHNNHNLAGVMFDDIGQQHRQGAALFYDNPIYKPDLAFPNREAWINRHKFFFTIHEMGHCFRLHHCVDDTHLSHWTRWLSNQEARSFMNYPGEVEGGEEAFFESFWYRFLDRELEFIRHAPEPLVQMGSTPGWDDSRRDQQEDIVGSSLELILGKLDLVLVRNFLVPVVIDVTLKNNSEEIRRVHEDVLKNPRWLHVTVQKLPDGEVKTWRPYHRYVIPRLRKLRKDYPMQAPLQIFAGAGGWFLNEPGMYAVRAWLTLPGEVVRSNELKVLIKKPLALMEETFGQDYFEPDVASLYNFWGSRSTVLKPAKEVLQDITEQLPDHPVFKPAFVALKVGYSTFSPELHPRMYYDAGDAADQMFILSEQDPDLSQTRSVLEQVLGKDEKLEQEARNILGNVLYDELKAQVRDDLEEIKEVEEAQDLLNDL